jgi:7,8-dihydropterin-6-yl-methyl-4-(beta-D-ribofuranosyl)aminobenzene 5'-phosphate synthase
MKIKIVAVGSSKWQRFIRRWGVSFLIGEDLLFDTFGDPGVLLNNMRKYEIDISNIKYIILSHDDWDHIAGLWYLLPNRKDITVYICPNFKQEIKDRISSFGVKVVEAGEMVRIKDGIYSTGELSGAVDGKKIYEQSIIIKRGESLEVICGCAHPGIVHIVQYVKQSFQGQIHSLIGGFHLKNNSTGTNLDIIQDLQILGVSKIAPMHCTGAGAKNLMRQAFGHGFIRVKEGDIIAP